MITRNSMEAVKPVLIGEARAPGPPAIDATRLRNLAPDGYLSNIPLRQTTLIFIFRSCEVSRDYILIPHILPHNWTFGGFWTLLADMRQ